jgi:hypothetical protein
MKNLSKILGIDYFLINKKEQWLFGSFNGALAFENVSKSFQIYKIIIYIVWRTIGRFDQ